MKQRTQKMELPDFRRSAAVRSASIDHDGRTVEVVASTGGRRRFYGVEEEIPVEQGRVRLDRMNEVAPVLDNHRSYGSVLDTLGSVVPGSARIEGNELVATLRFARTEAGDRALSMIDDGTIRAVSVGYDAEYERIRAKDREDGGEVDLYRAEWWEPYEVSLVSMPADAGAKIRGAEPQATRTYTVRYTEEDDMADRSAPANPEQNTPATPPALDEQGIMSRTLEIVGQTRQILKKNDLDPEKAEQLVREHASDELKIRSAVLDMLGERAANTRVNGHVSIEVGAESSDKRRGALVDSILHRMDPGSVRLDGESRQLRGQSMFDLARDCLEASGISTRSRSREEIAKLATRSIGAAGAHSTSDFPGILSDVANKRLRNAFTAQASFWKLFGRERPVNDFKPQYVYKISDFPDLLPVVEGGQYTDGTLNESSENWRVSKAGRIVTLTWEALINDDLSAFEAGLRGAGQAARRREDQAFFGQLINNVQMGDGVNLFDAARGNISAVTGAPSIATLTGGVVAMAKQTGDGPDSQDPLDLFPAYWLTPVKDRVAARVVVGADQRRAPDATANQIPPEYEDLQVFGSMRLDGGVNDDAHYLIASPNIIDTFEYGYLRGEEGPSVTQDEMFRGDGTAFKVRHVFGLKFIEPRAFVKIPKA